MAIVEPGKILKDNTKILLMALGVLVVVVLLSYVYGKGGSLFNYPGVTDGDGDGDVTEDGGTDDDDHYLGGEGPEMVLKVGVDYTATIETSKGDIEVDLFEDRAPVTVNNFVVLSEDNFYDDLLFHRVVEGFVIQGGDPEGDGTGGPGYSFKDEINAEDLGLDDIQVKDASFLSQLYSPYNAATSGYAPNSLKDHQFDSLAEFYSDVIGYEYDSSLDSEPFAPGVIAMANSGPSTNGSQFFITVGNSQTGSLNGRHTVFGKVLDGMDVVDSISEVLVNQSNKPVDDVTIERITIHED